MAGFEVTTEVLIKSASISVHRDLKIKTTKQLRIGLRVPSIPIRVAV